MKNNKVVIDIYKLMIVDDEEIIRSGLAKRVKWERLGYEVVCLFEDGRDAISYLHNNPVDVVLSDIKMCEVSGIELARYISENYPAIKVVLLSGYKEFDYAKEAIKYDVCDYILKPVKIEELSGAFLKIRDILDHEKNIATAATIQFSSYEGVDHKKALNCCGVQIKEDAKESAVVRAKKFIDDNLATDFSFEDVAKSVFLSSSYFSRLFKSVTGETITDYVIRRRIDLAIGLIKEGRHSVKEISEMVGYRDIKYFHRFFKKHTGYTVKQAKKLTL